MKCPKCKEEINIGALLGSISSPAKTKAARENAKKGGWPKGRKRLPVVQSAFFMSSSGIKSLPAKRKNVNADMTQGKATQLKGHGSPRQPPKSVTQGKKKG